MNERPLEERSQRLRALGLLASLCPPGDEDETVLQLELREHLLDDWATPILVEACRRLAKTWTWRRMPLPGDIDRVCIKVKRDCKKFMIAENEPLIYMALDEAKELLAASLDEPDSKDKIERFAENLWRSGLQARIELGEEPIDYHKKQLAPVATGNKGR